MAEPKYRTVRIPKPRSRGIRGKMALQRWRRSGGRQKQILNPKTGKYERVLFGDAGQRQLQKLYPTKERGETIKKIEKSKVEQSKRNIAGAAEAKKKAAEISAKGKKDREAKAKAKADAEAKAKADAEAKAKRAAAKPKADPKPKLPPPPAPPKAQPKPTLAKPKATRGRGEPDLPIPPVAKPAPKPKPAPVAKDNKFKELLDKIDAEGGKFADLPPLPSKPTAPQPVTEIKADSPPPTTGRLTRGPSPEAPPPPPRIRITEEVPKPPAPKADLSGLSGRDQEKLNTVLKDLKNKVVSPDLKTPTQAEIAEAVTKATGGKYTPPTPKVAKAPPPKAEPVAVAPKATQELAMPTVIDIPGGGQVKVPSIPALKTVEAKKAEPVQAVKAEPVQAPKAVTRVPTPKAVLDANKAAGSPVADVVAVANAQKVGGTLNADQIRSLINEGKMDPDDDYFIDREGIFGEQGLRYNKGVPETVVDQIVKDRQQAAAAAQQASGQTGPIVSVPDPQAKPLAEVAQQPVDDGGVFMPMPGQDPPPRDPVTEPAPEPPPPPQFVNMDPLQGFRETYIPTNLIGQAYDPSVRDAYTQQMMQAGANIQSGGYPMFKTPTSAIPQVQFGGYGAPMPIAPLMPYAGLAAPQPPQTASGAIVNPGTGQIEPVGMAPPPRFPGT